MTHLHAHRAPPYKCVDIDEHGCLQPTAHSNAPAGVVLNTPEADAYGEHLSGFIVGHDRPGFDVRCEGHVTVCEHFPEDHHWQMSGTLEGSDLTLSPSILCTVGSLDDPASGTGCGFHGFVRGGKWVPA